MLLGRTGPPESRARTRAGVRTPIHRTRSAWHGPGAGRL